MEEQREEQKPNVDLALAIKESSENIEKTTKLQNDIWQGILKLVITLSSSMLVLSFAFVEKVFNDNLPKYIVFSWLFFFIAIIFGILALVNEVIFFSNCGHRESYKRARYARLLFDGKKVIYEPQEHSDLISYNEIKWGAITVIAFFLAVIFIALALFDKVVSVYVCMGFLSVCVGSLGLIIIHFIRKRKTE